MIVGMPASHAMDNGNMLWLLTFFCLNPAHFEHLFKFHRCNYIGQLAISISDNDFGIEWFQTCGNNYIPEFKIDLFTILIDISLKITNITIDFIYCRI